MATNRDKKDGSSPDNTSSLVGLATGMGFSLLIFIGGGVFLDNIFKTTPLFVLFGVFFALASIGLFFWKIVQAAGTKP